MDNYERGQRRWKNRHKKLPDAEHPSAAEAAKQMVARLAPELEITHLSRYGVDFLCLRGTQTIVASANGAVVNNELQCCSQTFNMFDPLERAIPEHEKALTCYLYAKLLPERFRTRPLISQLSGPPPPAGRIRHYFHQYGALSSDTVSETATLRPARRKKA